MKPLAIDVTELTPGARELVQEFLRQYAAMQPQDITSKKTQTICIRGRRYDAARDAFYAIARCGIYPHLEWSMHDVRFTLNSGIPCTVGVYTPPDAPEIMSENAMMISLVFCLTALIVGAAVLGVLSQIGAITVDLDIEFAAAMVAATFSIIFGIAPGLAHIRACRIYKR